MKIESGLFDRMVLQRDGNNRSAARFTGVCQANGMITVRITSRGKLLKGWQALRVGRAYKGRCRGILKGLPVGGPYDIELKVTDTAGNAGDMLRVRNVLVGDVWILAGQSNMQGIGCMRDALPPHPHVRMCRMCDDWDIARDPLHLLAEARDPVYGGPSRRLAGEVNQYKRLEIKKLQVIRGVGPGLAFGQEMQRRTGIPQGLIPCALGGTSMQQWDPALKSQGGKGLYGATLRRFLKNGGRVAGVVWYQGCSDANDNDAQLYTRRMKKLVQSFRRDCGQPALPWAIVQIARVIQSASTMVAAKSQQNWHSIQEQQRLLTGVIPHCTVVPAIDLELDDGIHLSGREQNRLGRRLAQAMCVLRGDRRAGKPPIAIRSTTLQLDRQDGSNTVRVRFDNVMGRLQASGKPAGFCFPEPTSINVIYRVDLEGDTAVLRLGNAVQKDQLYYGYGPMPYCNITDSADRSLPVFGPFLVDSKALPPMPAATAQALFPFVPHLEVSKVLPLTGKFTRLAYPRNLSALGFKKRGCPLGFCDLRTDWSGRSKGDELVYLACRFECRSAMKLNIGLGYDGPVKVWLDGQPSFSDPGGANPMGIDKVLFPCDAAAGRHEILMALAANGGWAWGVRLRLLRRDLPLKILQRGPKAYAAPRVIG